MSKTWPVVIILAIIIVAAIAALSQPTLPGTDCSQSQSSNSGFGGSTARDSTLLAIEANYVSIMQSGTYMVTDNCMVLGDSISVPIYAPHPGQNNATSPLSATINLTVKQYSTETAYETLNGTGNTTYQHPYTVETNIEPDNQYIDAYSGLRIVYTFELPSTSTPMQVSIAYDGVNWTFWHVTPSALVVAPHTLGETYGLFAGILIASLFIFGICLAAGKAFVRKVRWVPAMSKKAKLIVAAIGLVMPLWVFTDYQAWQMSAGSIGLYGAAFIPFTLLVFIMVVTNTKGSSTMDAGISIVPQGAEIVIREVEKEETEEKEEKDGHTTIIKRTLNKSTLKAETAPFLAGQSLRVTMLPDGTRAWVPPGVDAFVLRIFFGAKKGCPPVNDKALFPYPYRYVVTDIAGLDRAYTLPYDAVIDKKPPHVRWPRREKIVEVTQDNPTEGTPPIPGTTDLTIRTDSERVVKVTRTETRHKWHWFEVVEGHCNIPAFGKKGALAMSEYMEGAKKVNEIAMDLDKMEMKLLDLELHITDKAQELAKEKFGALFEPVHNWPGMSASDVDAHAAEVGAARNEPLKTVERKGAAG